MKGLLVFIRRLPFLAAGLLVLGAGTVVTPATSQWRQEIRLQSAVAAAVSPGSEDKVTDPVPLIELRTGGNAGLFWTLSEAEAASAVSQYGMTVDNSRLGYLYRQQVSGTQPIFRLRSTTRPTYLLTASAGERDSLAASGQFLYEGVLGYAFTSRQPGTAELWRMSSNGWRAVPDAQRAAFAASGYNLDGPLGYVYPRYDRVGAIYFGTFDADGNQALMANAQRVYGRSQDWWAGVKDFAGYDVPQNKWHWPAADFSDLKPSIGYYDDSEPSTLEKQIAQAAGAGLRYFAFYWYWNPANGGSEQLIDGLKSFLAASNSSRMEFAVMPCVHPWKNGNVSLRIPAGEITKAAGTIVDSYLGQRNYLRANDGRPVIMVCDTRGIGNGTSTTVDTAATRQFVDAIRAEAQARYHEDVLVTLNDQLGAPASGSGFDGTQVMGRYDTSRSYQTYVAIERSRIANYPGVLIRGASSGFDNRPWDAIGIADPGPGASEQQLEASFGWYPDHTIGRFGTLLADIQADIDASTRPPTADNFVLIYAWNEWHEGGHIEPDVRDGCAYLNTIQAGLNLTGPGCVTNPGVP